MPIALTIVISIAAFFFGWFIGSDHGASEINRATGALEQANDTIVRLGRELGLMEAQRNHARWKNGRRRAQMRIMRKMLAEKSQERMMALGKELLARLYPQHDATSEDPKS